MSKRPVVLMVEDNPGDVALVQQTFEACGIDASLVPVENAVKAYSYLAQRGAFVGKRLPDLVLLDLNLPVIDGKQVLETINRDPAWRGVKVVVFTSSDRGSDRSECEALGAVAYQVKPNVWPGFIEFGKRIKRLLEARGTRRPTATLA